MSDSQPPATAETELPGRKRLTLRQSHFLHGPNAWSQDDVARFQIDAGSIGPFSERALQAIASGADPASIPSDEAGVIDAGQLFVALVLEMQQEAGYDLSMALSWPTDLPGLFEMICEYQDASVAQRIATLAVRALNHQFLHTEPGFEFSSAFAEDILAYMSSRRAEPKARDLVVKAARRRGIPVRIDDPPFDDVVELGTGIHQRRYWHSRVTSTGLLGGRIAERKPLTNHILRERGIPVPDGRVASSARAAVAAANDIGYPVIVKPVSFTGGWGVTPNLTSASEVRRAYEKAVSRSGGRSVLVEEYLPGREFRVLVIDDQLAAVGERVHAHVTGDGARSIRQLIDELNEDPRRQPDHPNRLAILEIDDEVEAVLASQGLTTESLPDRGTYVRLRPMAGARWGGYSINRTDEIHPDNVVLARMAARAIGLDICGVDLLTPDISKPIWQEGGVILEVNSSPAFSFHMDMTDGEPIDLGPAVVDLMFPPGQPFRVPVVAITGANRTDEVAGLVGRIMAATGNSVGVASSTGASVSRFPMRNPEEQAYSPIRAVLSNATVDFAVVTVDALDVEARGLGLSAIDVAVVTETSRDAPGAWRSPEEVLIDTAGTQGTIVLDAGDRRIAQLLTRASGPVFLTSLDDSSPELVGHLAGGGTAIGISASSPRTISVHRGLGGTEPILELASAEQLDPDHTRSVLQAVAVAVSLNVPFDVIRSSLTASTSG